MLCKPAKDKQKAWKPLDFQAFLHLVEATRFELATSASRTTLIKAQKSVRKGGRGLYEPAIL